MQNDERKFHELTPEEQATIRAIPEADFLTNVKYLRTWTDDGLPCVGMSVNGVEMGFWWLDTEEAAAFLNPSSADAKMAIFKHLRQGVGAGLDDEDEFEYPADPDSYGYNEDGGSW